MIGLTYPQLRELSPCDDSRHRVTKLMGGVKKWNGRVVTAAEARAAGCTLADLVWAAAAVARSTPEVERRLRLWSADCAARVLHIYERTVPSDRCVRNAIVASRRFACGEIDDAARAVASAAAWAAAWAVPSGVVYLAAWDAAWAAARAVASGGPGAAARAAAAAAARDARDAVEEAWQFDRLVARLSDSEPEDWPLPEEPN